MSTQEKTKGKEGKEGTAASGDQNAPPGTPEHLGSDRPYEGGSWPESTKEA